MYIPLRTVIKQARSGNKDKLEEAREMFLNILREATNARIEEEAIEEEKVRQRQEIDKKPYYPEYWS